MSDKSEDQILIIADSAESNPYSQLLFDALDHNGVKVITPDLPILFPFTRSLLKNRDVDVIQLDWLHKFYMAQGFSDYAVVNRLITYGRTPFFILDLVFVSLLGRAIVWTVHNKYHHEEHCKRTNYFVNVIVSRLSDALTVKCDNAKEKINKLYKIKHVEKIHVVRDGNYKDAYPNNISKKNARKELSMGDDTFVFLYFGLIRPYKGVPELIEEFSALSLEKSELWIVGNPFDEEIRREVEVAARDYENIELVLRYIPSEDIQLYLNAADVLVLPYRDILNSGSAHLGLTFGKPLVIPSRGCVPEIVPEHNFIYDPDNEDGLRENLVNANQSNELERISEQNFQRASELDWETPGQLLSDIYRDCVSN